VSYRWKEAHGNAQLRYGFIAQEVEKEVPLDAALISRDEILGMNYSELIAPLVKAVQELSAQVTHLQARIQNLEKAR
jgi:hypothetical protein